MAFDLFSGTLAITCLIVLIITSISLYYNQTSSKQLVKAQLYDVIDQINAAHQHHFAMTKDIQVKHAQLESDLRKLQSSVKFLESQMQKSQLMSIFTPDVIQLLESQMQGSDKMSIFTPVSMTTTSPSPFITSSSITSTTARPLTTTSTTTTTPRPLTTTTTPRPL